MSLEGPLTETGICNGALAMLGIDERLSDVTSDPGINARRCRLAYARVRDGLLAQFPWNFAARRASLAASPEPPAWGYARQYALPADFLRLRAVRGADMWDRYVIEQGPGGRVILSDRAAPLDILYTARVSGVTQYDALFVQALTAHLAADLAMPVTQTRSLHDQLALTAARATEAAQIADSREGTAGEQLPADSWLLARG